MNIKDALYIYGACTSEITRSINPAPRKYGPWARQLYVLIYVFKGKGYLEVNRKTYTITAGQSFLIFPGVTVCYWADDEDEWDYFWVDFNGEFAGEIAASASFPVDSPVLPKRESKIYDIFSKFVGKSYTSEKETQENSGRYFSILSDFYELFAEYASVYSAKPTSEDLTEKIVQYISDNFSDPNLTPDSLAEYFGISRTGLYRLFGDKLGTTPKKHINNIRIENACTILHERGRQIKDIALSVGFSDPLYFSKVFKERTGVSPSEYTEYYKNVLA